MPSRSAYVSVGSPIIKYSFTEVYPTSKAFSILSISASVMFLFMTSLSLCVPASGAKVSELLLEF